MPGASPGRAPRRGTAGRCEGGNIEQWHRPALCTTPKGATIPVEEAGPAGSGRGAEGTTGNEVAGMKDWKPVETGATTQIEWRLDDGPWQTETIGEKDQRLGQASSGSRLQVRNRGPVAVYLDGRYGYSKDLGRGLGGEWTVNGRSPFGFLDGGEEDSWLTGDERLYAAARPDAVFIDRGPALELERQRGTEAGGNRVERVFDWYLRARGLDPRPIRTALASERHMKTPDRTVTLNGTPTTWEMKAIVSEEGDRIADRQWGEDGTKRNATLRQAVRRAAEQLRKAAEAGQPTITAVMNLRKWDPFAIGKDLIADTLYGEPVATIYGERAELTGRTGPRTAKLEHISAVMTLQLMLATWLGEERGKALSELTNETRLVCLPVLCHNANAKVRLPREAAMEMKAREYLWTEAGAGRAMVVHWKTLREWDGLAVASGMKKPVPKTGRRDDTSLETIAATGITTAREAILGAIERNARELEREAADRRKRLRRNGEAVLDTHAAWIGEGGPDLDDTWARFCLPDTENNGALVVAGSKMTAAEVLERVAAGESYEEITRLSASDILPEGEPGAAVRAAGETAALLIVNSAELPPVTKPLERVPGRCGGRPVLTNSRLGASDILASIAAGETIAEVAADAERKDEEIEAAVRYGAAVLRHGRGTAAERAGAIE